MQNSYADQLKKRWNRREKVKEEKENWFFKDYSLTIFIKGIPIYDSFGGISIFHSL